MECIELGEKFSIAAAVISVVLLLIDSPIIGNTKMQALAQQPDHLYTPKNGILHQTPERLTLPLLSQK